MKIVKKIGIGFLALILCFCSCFKFVNAESLEFIDEPFTLVDGNFYNLYIDNSYIYEDYTLICYYTNGDYFCEIAFLGNELNTIQIEDSNGLGYEMSTTYSGTYYNAFNSITYNIYSFEYTELSELAGFMFLYDDLQICFLNQNTVDNSFSVYYSIYQLIEHYIFGDNIPNNSFQELTATLLSGLLCILTFALPFLIIWKVIKVIVG